MWWCRVAWGKVPVFKSTRLEGLGVKLLPMEVTVKDMVTRMAEVGLLKK
jgi:hypothetical protein